MRIYKAYPKSTSRIHQLSIHNDETCRFTDGEEGSIISTFTGTWEQTGEHSLRLKYTTPFEETLDLHMNGVFEKKTFSNGIESFQTMTFDKSPCPSQENSPLTFYAIKR
jgi:hypothetical protein